MVARREHFESRRGLATLEAVIILPVLLALVLGLLEYGWLFWKAADINNAARQGARVGSRAGATEGDIQASVLNVLTACGLEGSGYVVEITPGNPLTLNSGEQLTVTVRVEYAQIALINSVLIPTPEFLSGTVVMVREGP